MNGFLAQAGNEKEILENQVGSPRYMQFVEGLGQLTSLPDVDQSRVFIGGLNTSGHDGEFTYVWHDEIMQGTSVFTLSRQGTSALTLFMHCTSVLFLSRQGMSVLTLFIN